MYVYIYITLKNIEAKHPTKILTKYCSCGMRYHMLYNIHNIRRFFKMSDPQSSPLRSNTKAWSFMTGWLGVPWLRKPPQRHPPKKWSSVRFTKASVGQTFLGQNVEKGPLRDIWDPNQIHGDFMGDMVIPLGFTAMLRSEVRSQCVWTQPIFPFLAVLKVWVSWCASCIMASLCVDCPILENYGLVTPRLKHSQRGMAQKCAKHLWWWKTLPIDFLIKAKTKHSPNVPWNISMWCGINPTNHVQFYHFVVACLNRVPNWLYYWK